MKHTTTHDRRWWTLAVLMLALLVVGIDQTILNVALPVLAGELSASATQLQWMVESYVLVFAGLLLTGGALGDRFGRRKALIAGLVLFASASSMASLATTASVLIAARAVMGIGGALIMPATLSVLTNVFPEDERAKAIGVWAAVSSLGIVIGPIAGGWLLDHFWWGAIFLVNVPVAAVAVAAATRLVPDSRDPSEARLDPIGAVLSTLGLTAALYAIIEGPTHGWASQTTLTALVAGLVLLLAFLVWELRTARPMLDVRLFSDRRFSAASLSITLVFFALNGGMFFLTQHLQFVLGYRPLEAGIRLIPVAVAVAITAPTSARLAARFGARTVVATGLAVTAAGLAVLATATVTSGYSTVLITLVIVGIGIGLAGTPATDSIMSAVPPERAGVGSAVNDTTREVGGALGVAVLGTALTAGYRSSLAGTIVQLPQDVAAVFRESIGGAVHVAAAVGGEQGASLLAMARGAFIDAMGTTVLIGAAVAAVGALIAAIYLPARQPVTGGPRGRIANVPGIRPLTVGDRLAVYGAPVGFLLTSLLHPSPSRTVTADLAADTEIWIIIHVVQLFLIAGLATSLRRLLDGHDGRAARVARAATIPFVALYAGFDALVGLATGLLAVRAESLVGPARQAVLEAGDAIFFHPVGYVLAAAGVAAWLVATIGGAVALRRIAPPTVTGALVVAGVLFGLTHVGIVGFGGAAALLAAIHASRRSSPGAHAPRAVPADDVAGVVA